MYINNNKTILYYRLTIIHDRVQYLFNQNKNIFMLKKIPDII